MEQLLHHQIRLCLQQPQRLLRRHKLPSLRVGVCLQHGGTRSEVALRIRCRGRHYRRRHQLCRRRLCRSQLPWALQADFVKIPCKDRSHRESLRRCGALKAYHQRIPCRLFQNAFRDFEAPRLIRQVHGSDDLHAVQQNRDVPWQMLQGQGHGVAPEIAPRRVHHIVRHLEPAPQPHRARGQARRLHRHRTLAPNHLPYSGQRASQQDNHRKKDRTKTGRPPHGLIIPHARALWL